MLALRIPRRTVAPLTSGTMALAFVLGLVSIDAAPARAEDPAASAPTSATSAAGANATGAAISKAATPLASMDGSMLGKPVFSSDGKEIGSVRDVVMVDGQARVLNVAHGGFLGVGEKNAEIDVSRVSAGPSGIVVQMTAEQVAQMPDIGDPSDAH